MDAADHAAEGAKPADAAKGAEGAEGAEAAKGAEGAKAAAQRAKASSSSAGAAGLAHRANVAEGAAAELVRLADHAEDASRRYGAANRRNEVGHRVNANHLVAHRRVRRRDFHAVGPNQVRRSGLAAVVGDFRQQPLQDRGAGNAVYRIDLFDRGLFDDVLVIWPESGIIDCPRDAVAGQQFVERLVQGRIDGQLVLDRLTELLLELQRPADRLLLAESGGAVRA